MLAWKFSRLGYFSPLLLSFSERDRSHLSLFIYRRDGPDLSLFLSEEPSQFLSLPLSEGRPSRSLSLSLGGTVPISLSLSLSLGGTVPMSFGVTFHVSPRSRILSFLILSLSLSLSLENNVYRRDRSCLRDRVSRKERPPRRDDPSSKKGLFQTNGICWMVEMLEQLTFKFFEGNFRLRHGEIFLCSQFMDACFLGEFL